jgi:Concanavalin A-like lectin/glucanases superfamily/Bacterial Ig domain
MTLEAWVKPSVLTDSWRTVLLKEEPGGLAYALYAHTSSQGPSVHFSTGGSKPRARSQTALTAGTWTHLADTNDGTALRLYVNGALALSQATAGAISTSASALRIGGNNVWSEWFQGLIDDVRIYNRALTPAEFQTDMQTPVGDATPPPSDTTPPNVAITAPAAGTTVSGTVPVSAAASDNVGIRGVQFTLDGQAFGAEDTAAPYGLDWDTRIFANGPHSLGAIARDAAGNRTTSLAVPVTVDNAAPPPPTTTGLVAAYGFGEGAGTSAGDASGSGNAGVLSGAAWTGAGRHGSALSFDGVNDLVTIADAASLELMTGMTVEAWVKPASGGSPWQTVVLKEQSSHLGYALYASASGGVPSGHAYVGVTDERTNGPAPLPLDSWSHLAVTYDGDALRLYRDGAEISTAAVAGPISTGAGPLRIGGNTIWSEWFHGVIDDVPYTTAPSPMRRSKPPWEWPSP